MACREWCYGMVKVSDSGASLNVEPMGFIDGLIYVGCERGESRMITKLLYKSVTFAKVIYTYDLKFMIYKNVHIQRSFLFFPLSYQFASVETSKSYIFEGSLL